MTKRARGLAPLIAISWLGLAILPAQSARGAERTDSSAVAAGSSVSIEPAVIELHGSERMSFERSITLINGTLIPLRFEIVVEDVVVRDGRRFFLPAGEAGGSIAATAVIGPAELVLQPGQSGSVKIIVTVPERTPVRAVAVFFRSRMPQDGSGASIALNLGSLVTFRLAGESELVGRNLQLRSSATGYTVAQTVSNEGDEPLIATGTVAIVDANGELRDRAEFSSTRLLPGESAELRVDSMGKLSAGWYRAVVTMEYENRRLTDETSVRLGDGS